MGLLSRLWRKGEVKKNCKLSGLIFLLMLSLTIQSCKNPGPGNSNNANSASPVNPPAENQPTSAPPTPIKEQSNILFIIDSSGSMKAKVAGQTKMETAKEVLSNLVTTLPPETQVGLMAYGHRSKNDCRDTELLVPFEKRQAELFRQKVENLQPLGQTPISYALRQAAEVLKGKTGTKSIILISDGEETCHEDPCLVAAELNKAQIDLKIHVIGFGIDTATAKKQLTCIAESTGGTYKDAQNAEGLKKTLEDVTVGSEGTSDKSRLITVSLDSTGDETRWKIYVYSAGTETEIVNQYDSTSPVKLSPGKYDVKYERNCSPAIWKRGVEIKAGQDTRIELERLGRVHPIVRDSNGNEVSGLIEVHKDSQELCLNMNSTDPTELYPGIYDFRFWSPKLIYGWSKGVEVKSGQEIIFNIMVGPE
jgi:hypothetical protein